MQNERRLISQATLDAKLSLFAETLLELGNTTTGVQNLLLAGVKRMARGGDFHIKNWVLNSVFPNCLLVSFQG
jgi:hypothetical protein